MTIPQDGRWARVELPARPKILVITLRRLGDVLMTTPLVRTLRRAWPDADLDMLLFKGTERILKGNPDIDRIVTMSQRPAAAELFSLLRQLWRRYDLVVSTQSGDRPTFLSFVAGRRRIGLVLSSDRGRRWKELVYHRPVVVERECHRFDELLGLAGGVGVPLLPDVVCPQGSTVDPVAPAGPYAVLHATPFETYRRWNAEGWRGLARGLAERGLAVVATEGRSPEEQAYVESLFGSLDVPVVRERGRLDWPGLAALLKGAEVYVGPDTSMTHLAAASGAPTVALHGSTSPRRIAAWPLGGFIEPWHDRGAIQNRGNVWVVQNMTLPCLPCEKLGCDGHVNSRAQCLDELSARQVLAAVDQALASRRERAGWPGGAKAAKEGAGAAPTEGP